MYKELKITVTENSFLNDNMYTKKELLKFFKEESNLDWHYNIDRNIFGYGSDCIDWENKGENYLYSNQIMNIYQLIDDKKNEYTISYYEEEENGKNY